MLIVDEMTNKSAFSVLSKLCASGQAVSVCPSLAKQLAAATRGSHLVLWTPTIIRLGRVTMRLIFSVN